VRRFSRVAPSLTYTDGAVILDAQARAIDRAQLKYSEASKR